MRNLPVLFLIGCNSFTTVDEACLPNGLQKADVVTRPTDLEMLERANCHRRLAKRGRAPIDPLVQGAVEGHRDWLEANAPELLIFSQISGTPGFTGANATARLAAAEYVMPDDGELTEVAAWAYGDFATSLPRGGEYFDFWFEDPFLRTAWLQPVVYAAGAAEADYVISYPETLGLEDEPTHVMYWNVIHSVPAAPYAEPPVSWPRDGQLDVPPDYTHLTDQTTGLEVGQTYGFPITFTVGSAERNVELTQASIEGPDGASVPFTVLAAADLGSTTSLTNSVGIVPDQPLQTGGTYTVRVRISSELGERPGRTTFTVGGESRPIPAFVRSAAREGIPAYTRVPLSRDATPGSR